MKLKKIYCILLAILIAGSCGMTSVYAAAPENATPKLSIGQVTADKGQEVILPVCISDNPGFAGIRLDVEYDTEIFSLVTEDEEGNSVDAIEKGDVLDVLDSGHLFSKEIEKGCQIFWWNETDKNTDGTLFLIHLKVSEDAEYGKYPINISYYPKDTGNEKENLVEFTCQNGMVEIKSTESMIYGGTVKIKAGQTIDYPVYIKNNPGISSIMVYVRALGDNLQAVTDDEGMIVAERGTFSEKGTVLANDYLSGWKILWYTTEGDQHNDGSVFTLKLKADEEIEEGDISVAVTCMPGNTTDSAGNKVSIDKVARGTLEVRTIRYGDIDNNMQVDFIDAIWLKRYVSGWSGYENIDTEIADLNCDGKVNLKDAAILERYISGWIGYDKLPAAVQ